MQHRHFCIPTEGEAAMQETQHKKFGKPGEVRQFPNGHADIVSIGDSEVG